MNHRIDLTIASLGALVWALACGGGREIPARILADGPVTLDDVRALADAGAVVTEDRYDPAIRDACDDSPYCFLLFPLAPLSPDVVHVTVDRAGERTWEGWYRPAGGLLFAMSRVPAGWERIERLENPELGEPWLVVTHTSPPEFSAWQPARQDALVAETYVPALLASPYTHERVALVQEVIAQMPHSAGPVIAWLYQCGSDYETNLVLAPPEGSASLDPDLLERMKPAPETFGACPHRAPAPGP